MYAQFSIQSKSVCFVCHTYTQRRGRKRKIFGQCYHSFSVSLAQCMQRNRCYVFVTYPERFQQTVSAVVDWSGIGDLFRWTASWNFSPQRPGSRCYCSTAMIHPILTSPPPPACLIKQPFSYSVLYLRPPREAVNFQRN